MAQWKKNFITVDSLQPHLSEMKIKQIYFHSVGPSSFSTWCFPHKQDTVLEDGSGCLWLANVENRQALCKWVTCDGYGGIQMNFLGCWQLHICSPFFFFHFSRSWTGDRSSEGQAEPQMICENKKKTKNPLQRCQYSDELRTPRGALKYLSVESWRNQSLPQQEYSMASWEREDCNHSRIRQTKQCVISASNTAAHKMGWA